MENNTNCAVNTETTLVESTQEPIVDYKSLYEKSQKDYANLNKYNKDLKEKYQAKLTDEEKQKAEMEAREEHYKNLEKELSLSKFKSSLSGRITDSKALDEIASKFADGDTHEALSLLADFETKREANLRKQIEQELLAQNPQTPPASGAKEKSWKDMTASDWNKLQAENPEEYKKMIKTIK